MVATEKILDAMRLRVPSLADDFDATEGRGILG